MVLRLLALFCLTSLCQSSLAQQSRLSRPRVPDTCPVTKPSDRPFVAPPPYRPYVGGDAFCLDGAAAPNAALVWFGGRSLAAGGGGVIGEELGLVNVAGAASVDLEVIEKMAGGKYLALARHLAKREHMPVQLRFSDVEEIIGESLPVSARKHRAWWGNESSRLRVQAVAWMGIGWKVAEVDLASEWVRFERR